MANKAVSPIALITDYDDGLSIAALLVNAGYQVICHDRRKSKSKKAKPPTGVTTVTSIKDALKSAATVVTVVKSQQSDEDVYMMGGGVLAHAKAASLFVDMSPISPRMAREMHALAAVHDHRYVDAPYLGNVRELQANQALLFAGGEPGALKQAMPLLGAISQNILETGLPGTGAATRLAWQIALAGSLLGLVEAISFAALNSVDKSTIVELLKGQNSLIAGVAGAYGPAIEAEDFNGGLSVAAYLDDLNLALESADEGSLPLPGLETVQQLYDLLQLISDDRRGIQSLALAYYDDRNSERFGLNWQLAQKAMDVYERGGEDDEDEYDMYYDEDQSHHDHAHHQDRSTREGYGFDGFGEMGGGPEGNRPSTGNFFSDN